MKTATDLFGGAGGSSEGLRRAGWHVAIAANHWPTAVATHQLNDPDTEHRIKDLSEVDWRTFPSTDLLWASPSCVWHARSGGRKRPPAEVERLRADAGAIDRATAFAVIEAAEVHHYPAILVENVVEFLDWTLFPWWLDGLRALGYQTETLVLDAKNFGHAQNRKRLFVAATRGLDVDLTAPSMPAVTAADILDPDPGKEVARRLYVSDQIDQIDTEGVPHLVTYRRHARPRRADRHQLATITAGGNHHAVATIVDGRPHHRMLTNRECARAQGFDDDYEFVGTAAEVKRQIGNAVPVGIAHWLGSRVAAALGTQQLPLFAA
ncbi:DNA cytosine methyltransferase [Amycolatopsis thermophila]|uniref:DNA (cytosine-5-)-methyltransferase n=1 Tax=Amycolatopsis thermophila TaxID=206084 RepID=A0ABU0ERK2_9PSEU|nr:DNA cytosine methyltransferase [Amycolatopsis thermophila]MDQ0377928.1 DNA (cytosine-5)-methyltransferase 1 [Amycolatopsis thermophila]